MFSFVWRAVDFSTVALESVLKADARCIVALSEFAQIAALPDSVDILVSVRQIQEIGWCEALFARKFGTIWISCLPQPTIPELQAKPFLPPIPATGDRFGWIVGSLEALERIRQVSPDQYRFALKGNESAGYVGRETLLTLFAAARNRMRRQDSGLELHVWGGVATPEGAAALLAAGARGIVFESLHWLTDQFPLTPDLRAKLAVIQVDHTRVVGTNINLPYRLFDKGNSTAAKHLSAIRNPDLFAVRITDEACDPLDSRFVKEQVVPLGIEAAFAAPFVRRFGNGTGEALQNFRAAVENSLYQASLTAQKFLDSPLATAWGAGYPVFQGAMSWITDVPEFAKKVADSGAIPTLALGVVPPELLQSRFGGLNEALAGRPYAVNLLALKENPERESQLAWIRKIRPRFVVIAAGEPSFGKQLLADGLDVIYIAPTEELAKMALELGYRHILCEGSESGGHIGTLSMFTLAQSMLDLRDLRPDLFVDRTLILAGGVCNRETSFIAAMLGADAIQMGTAYLMTEEIVETGALSALYQEMIRQAGIGDTVVTGESVGLRIRSLKNEKTRALLELELEYAKGQESEISFRERLETLAAGSLRTAAHGENPEDDVKQGQFMSGACAGLLHEVKTLAVLHHEVVAGPLALQLRQDSKAKTQPTVQAAVLENSHDKSIVHTHRRERVAITGMSLVNSLGNSPQEIWEACLQLRSGVTTVPESKWNHARFFDPRPMQPEKTYCDVGAFRDLTLSRQDIDVPPQDFRNMTDATKTALWVAKQAIEDSGIVRSDLDRQRISVILSQNATESSKMTADLVVRQTIPEMLNAIRRTMPLSDAQAEAIARDIAEGRNQHDDTSLLGRLSSMVPGFVCNKYGFTGPSYSVLAACASSLVAVHSAVQLLDNGIIDAAIVGGAEEELSPLHFMEFSILGALGGLSGRQWPPAERSRPFADDRDGLILGEGAGMLVLERESVAKRRGAHIYGYITGVGAGNNDTGMVESSRHSQLRTIRASFAGLDYGPETVDLVECHATATRQGDLEEIWALKTVFPSDKKTVLSSFKSQVGHTLGAAGINSLVRGIMAMNDGMFPPTINCENIDPAMQLENSGFTILSTPKKWPSHPDRPRRFQVNAFGFGGSNSVIQVEEPDHRTTTLPKPVTGYAGIQLFSKSIGGEPFRLAVPAGNESEARTLLEQEKVLSQPGSLTDKRRRALQRKGIFIAPATAAAQLALVFPGQGSQYVGMGQELYTSLSTVRRCLDEASEHFGFDVPNLLFSSQSEELQSTRWQQPAVFALEYALAQHFLLLGVRPVALAGHSLGQFTALCTAGVFSFADGCRIVNQRGLLMEKAGRLHQDVGIMLAAHADRKTIEPFLKNSEAVHILNINSPVQTVFGGDTTATLNVGEKLAAKGIRSMRLPVGMAFHSPMFGAVRDEFIDFLANTPIHSPQLPVLSNHTQGKFPPDPAQIRQLLADHMVSSVDWLGNVHSLATDYNVSVFLEVGPREALGNLIGDILPSAVRISVCMPSVETQTLRSAVAQLAVLGHLPFPSDNSGPKRSTPSSAPNPTLLKTDSVPSSARSFPDSALSSAVSSILQREINAFVLQCFGEILKPKLLNVLRQEVDPNFTEMQLEKILTAKNQIQPHAEPSPLPLSPDAPLSEPSLPSQQKADTGNILEDVIDVIVRTTGYERSEIEPDMDLREDLAIRSSRLPVIADALEHRLRVKLDLQVFAGVRTVRDVAERLESLINSAEKATAPNSDQPQGKEGDSPAPPCDIRRLTFTDQPLLAAAPQLLQLSPLDAIALVHAFGPNNWALEIADVLRRDHGATIGEAGVAAGLVITVDPTAETDLGMQEVTEHLRKTFLSLQQFLTSPNKKFVLLLHKEMEKPDSGHVLAECLLGMLLSAAWEFKSVLFRSVRVAGPVEPCEIVRRALDYSILPISLACRNGTWTVETAQTAPLEIAEQATLPGVEDVFLVSGGGSGVTSAWVRAMIPFGCHIVLLGRTSLEKDSEKSTQIQNTLQELKSAGIDAAYLTCDVTDSRQVADAVSAALALFGRVTGIIHGAGFLRDDFVPNIREADLTALLAVKTEGASNLFHACRNEGLRWFFALSSIAAVKGNPGQVAYTAANRSLAGLLDKWGAENPDLCCRALLLPPLEGGGMADTEELRALMPIIGYEYVHMDEMARLYCREFTSQPQGPVRVLFQRRAPETPTAAPTLLQANLVGTSAPGQAICNSFFSGSPHAFPLIDSLVQVDLKTPSVSVQSMFGTARDFWLSDHKPSNLFKFPLVSGIMMVELFFETARLLYPYLHPCGISRLQFLDMISCPPQVVRHTLCRCVQIEAQAGKAICELSLQARQIAPGGRDLNRLEEVCTANLLLQPQMPLPPETFPDFPVTASEPALLPVDAKALSDLYSHTGLQGRYRLLQQISLLGPDFAAALARIPTLPDFAKENDADELLRRPSQRYQFEPYALESIFQLIAFQASLLQLPLEETPFLIPYAVDEIFLYRRCAPGDELQVQARRRNQDDKGVVWDALALDSEGNAVLSATGVNLQWVTL